MKSISDILSYEINKNCTQKKINKNNRKVATLEIMDIIEESIFVLCNK